MVVAQRTEYGDVREVAIANSERIINLQREVRDLRDRFDRHETMQIGANEKQIADYSQLEVTVAEHERIIWVIVSAVAGMLVKMFADAVIRRKVNGNGKH